MLYNILYFSSYLSFSFSEIYLRLKDINLIIAESMVTDFDFI